MYMYTDRSRRKKVFLPSQHAPRRAVNALARVLRAFRAAGGCSALSVEALVVQGHPAAVPLLLEQARLRPQATEVHAQGRLDDRGQARKGQFAGPSRGRGVAQIR